MKSALHWVDARMPTLRAEWRKHAAEYYVPKNLNSWYEFGSLAGLVLIIQIVSGIFLTMNYKPDASLAFGSVEYIMRDVPLWRQFRFNAFFLDTKDIATWVARLCTIVYFLFFFLMPWYTARDKVKPVPERVIA